MSPGKALRAPGKEQKGAVPAAAVRGRAGSKRGGAAGAGRGAVAAAAEMAVRCGDAARALASMPDSSADLVVTSPPYFRQRSYGGLQGETGREAAVEDYIGAVKSVFAECTRVVRDTGSIVFNMGDKYLDGDLVLVPYRFALEAKQIGGVRLVNDITWVKTNPTPRQFARRFVSSTEPFFHFVRSNRYYYDTDAYERETGEGQGGMRRGGMVQAAPDGAAPAGGGPRAGHPRIGKGYEAIIEASGLSAGEKAAARKALREAVRDVQDGKIASFRMKVRGVHSPAFGGQEGGRNSQMANMGFTVIRLHGRTMRRDVMTSSVEALRGIGHPAVYPERIIRALIALLCPPGGTVVDPYMGSGTTGTAAVRTGRRYVGIDINPAYCRAARLRIAAAESEMDGRGAQALRPWARPRRPP